MGPSGRFTHVMIYWTVWERYMHVLYLGRWVVNGPPRDSDHRERVGLRG